MGRWGRKNIFCKPKNLESPSTPLFINIFIVLKIRNILKTLGSINIMLNTNDGWQPAYHNKGVENIMKIFDRFGMEPKEITTPDIVSFLIKEKVKGFLLSKKTIKEPGKYQINTYTLFGIIPIYRSVTIEV